jgi:hypothetical protein
LLQNGGNPTDEQIKKNNKNKENFGDTLKKKMTKRTQYRKEKETREP